MMSLKEAYEYLFYKVFGYSYWTTAGRIYRKIWGLFFILDWLVLIPLLFYFQLLFPYVPLIYMGRVTLFLFIALHVIRYYMFEAKDKWKAIIKKYDAWPQKKNDRGTLIVWGIVILLVANFILAINLYNQVDWSQYRPS